MAKNDIDDVEDFLFGKAALGQSNYILAHAALSLHRIALAQEAMAQMMQTDLSEQIELAIQERAEQRAQEIDETKSKRSFIGKGI